MRGQRKGEGWNPKAKSILPQFPPFTPPPSLYFHAMPLPVISVAQMREWEQSTWASGQTEAEVIRRVGRALASHALARTRPGELILVVAGSGHNGDDARAASGHLSDRRVETVSVTDPDAALPVLDQWLATHPALVVDGLLGIGLNRPLEGAWLEIVRRINQSGCPVLAVDVPSGLNAETGEPLPEAIQATVTLTVGAPKAGLLRPAAWPFVGRLEVAAEVGLLPCPATGELQWTLPEDFRGLPLRRESHGHKGTYGHLAIIAGNVGHAGAAVLAARAAQRARPGLITVITTQNAYYAVSAQCQAAMVVPWTTEFQLGDHYSAMLIGPGLANEDVPEALPALLRRLWRNARFPIITDASGITWMDPAPTPHNSIRVVTPHPGEASVLLKSTSPQVQANRLESLRQIARRYGNPWVVLKGHQTLIGRQDGPVFVNSSGGPYLAQGGSGDVLAGYLSGLIAQPAWQQNLAQTVRYAVWQHGAAADALETRQPNWVVEDLAAELGLAGWAANSR
jgi:NAD(P)H-hydrate epimerase